MPLRWFVLVNSAASAISQSVPSILLWNSPITCMHLIWANHYWHTKMGLFWNPGRIIWIQLCARKRPRQSSRTCLSPWCFCANMDERRSLLILLLNVACALRLVRFVVARRTHSNNTPKRAGKVWRVVKTDCIGDIRHHDIGVLKQLPGLANTVVDQIITKGNLVLLFKSAAKGAGIHSTELSYLFLVDFFMVVFFHEGLSWECHFSLAGAKPQVGGYRIWR